MDGLWEKISSYNIFNNLFPGALFVYFLERATHVVLSTDDIIKNVVLYYFVGLVIGRVGSIMFEPVLKFLRVVRFIPYDEYISACRLDSKIETLQEVANMYRTLFSMSLVLFLSLYLVAFLTGNTYGVSKCISLFFVIIFVISYAKQIGFITRRVHNANKKLP